MGPVAACVSRSARAAGSRGPLALLALALALALLLALALALLLLLLLLALLLLSPLRRPRARQAP